MVLKPNLVLPSAVVSVGDLNRLSRELSSLNDFFLSAAARKAGAAPPPRVTRILNSLATETNKYNLLDAKQRQNLAQELKTIQAIAPVMHISFASEPSPQAIERILVWLRTNIHPYALLQVGLQPTIAAGCVLRTTNQVFDMSLRSYLDRQKDYLVALVKGAVGD
ncbi:hypothetical protein HYW35_01540 [Candidatus Saccharibacteria bacterium]|nr:hypothetical protein [Candidatus Saccharibacteria bacterium]